MEDVAGDAFHGKVFVHRADVQGLRFQYDAVIGIVRDRAAAGDGGQFAAASPAQGAGQCVAVQVGNAYALTAAVTFGEHAQQRLIVLFIEGGVGRGPADHIQQGLLLPFLATDFGDDLLRQHIQWRVGDDHGVEFATPHAIEQRGAFDQVVA